jgi:3-dehydroquinate dehydratase/shikimate dehydrogenase
MSGGICIPVCASTVVELAEQIRSASVEADIVEVRFDSLEPNELTAALESLPDIGSRYLFTFRPKAQGGYRDISPDERAAFWAQVAKRKGNFLIDLEGDAPEHLHALFAGREGKIASLHNFDGTWERPKEIFDRLSGFGDIVKMAESVDDAHEAAGLWPILDSDKAAIPIAMGEAGQWTRVLALAHGAYLTYASRSRAVGTAPGQIPIRELKELYRAKELTARTKVFGILGNPVTQSLSRFMHNPAFRSVGFDGVFIPFLVKDIDAFMTHMVRPETREVDLNFGGFSVTMPHKQSIIEHLDDLDETAAKIGAVNTVKIANGKLTGYNTDAHGFISPLKKLYGRLDGARVAVLGAGGAARACVFALTEESAGVQVFAREPAKYAGLAAEWGFPIKQIADFAARDFDILVNATPVGMADGSLFTSRELDGVRFVYDLVTKPADTPLIAAAKEAGAEAIGGLEMLIAQGVKQFELWTGCTPPVEEMRESVLNRFKELADER